MNVYVLGAGVSKDVGYPLGRELLEEVDRFVRSYVGEFNRFQYSEWPRLLQRLAENENILIRQAYKLGHFEHLLTVLDHYELLTIDFILENMRARKDNSERAKSVQKNLTSTTSIFRQTPKTAKYFFLH